MKCAFDNPLSIHDLTLTPTTVLLRIWLCTHNTALTTWSLLSPSFWNKLPSSSFANSFPPLPLSALILHIWRRSPSVPHNKLSQFHRWTTSWVYLHCNLLWSPQLLIWIGRNISTSNIFYISTINLPNIFPYFHNNSILSKCIRSLSGTLSLSLHSSSQAW